MTDDRIVEAWDRVSAAIERVECALPRQMTDAMDALTRERIAMRNLIFAINKERVK